MKSTTQWHKSVWFVGEAASVILALSVSGVAVAQDGDKGWDLLDQRRRVEAVSSQKLALEIRTAQADADKLAATDPDKAIARLLSAITTIEADNVSPKDQRELAIKHFKTRITSLQSGVVNTGTRADEQEKKDKAIVRQRAERDQFAQDVADVKARLASIGKMQEDGNFDAAAKEATDLNKKYPSVPATKAADMSAETTDKITLQNKGIIQKNQGMLAGLNDVSKSAVLPKGDVDFPKDWIEKTKRRASANQLSAKEREIMRGLASPITLSLKAAKFEAALDQIRAKTGLSILLDPEALKEADVTYDTPVTIDARSVTLRTALSKVLGELGLRYIIKDETIYVTSAARARETMVVKRYYIGDLLASMNTNTLPSNNPLQVQTGPQIRAFMTPFGMPGFGLPGLVYGGNAPWPGQTVTPTDMLANQAAAKENANLIMEMVKNSVDPHSWTSGGGHGTISFHPSSMSIVIKQTAEMHALLGNGL
ncbi:hypothetical protein BH10PLA2_BH10PLA2_25200 [soil metagenome]